MNAVLMVTVVALAALLALLVVAWRRQRPVPTLDPQLQDVDLQAFQTLLDPAEEDFLRGRLPPAAFRRVQRKRTRAARAYLKALGENARSFGALASYAALQAPDAEAVAQARQVASEAVRLRMLVWKLDIRLLGRSFFPSMRLYPEAMIHGYSGISAAALQLRGTVAKAG